MKKSVFPVLVFLIGCWGCATSNLKMKSDGTTTEIEYQRTGPGTESPVEIATADAIIRRAKGEKGVMSADADFLQGIVVNLWDREIKINFSTSSLKYCIREKKFAVVEIPMAKGKSEQKVECYITYQSDSLYRKVYYKEKTVTKTLLIRRGEIFYYNNLLYAWKLVIGPSGP